MGRKKLKKAEQVVRVAAYVKRKHEERVMNVLKKEVAKIKLEELNIENENELL